MDQPVNKELKTLLNKSLSDLEKQLNSDVITYYDPIVNGNENTFLDIVEELATDANKKEQLAIALPTTGGSAMAVERYVNIIRKH